MTPSLQAAAAARGRPFIWGTSLYATLWDMALRVGIHQPQEQPEGAEAVGNAVDGEGQEEGVVEEEDLEGREGVEEEDGVEEEEEEDGADEEKEEDGVEEEEKEEEMEEKEEIEEGERVEKEEEGAKEEEKEGEEKTEQGEVGRKAKEGDIIIRKEDEEKEEEEKEKEEELKIDLIKVEERNEAEIITREEGVAAQKEKEMKGGRNYDEHGSGSEEKSSDTETMETNRDRKIDRITAENRITMQTENKDECGNSEEMPNRPDEEQQDKVIAVKVEMKDQDNVNKGDGEPKKSLDEGDNKTQTTGKILDSEAIIDVEEVTILEKEENGHNGIRKVNGGKKDMDGNVLKYRGGLISKMLEDLD